MTDGVVAVGGDLTPATLLLAYGRGIFPWYTAGQPIVWWSPDPRMVLPTGAFRLHRSLRKTLRRFTANPACSVRINHDFTAIIHACARQQRKDQHGTWIHPEMQTAYCELHRMGHAFSVETWSAAGLAGGLYGVVIGKAVFGESMFSRQTDASKIALATLAALCVRDGVNFIDCQQATAHLQHLGARTIARTAFLQHIQRSTSLPTPQSLVQRKALQGADLAHLILT